METPYYPARLVLLMLAIAIVAGCGKSEDRKKAATQVAAKVNSTEITVAQINAILARTPNVTPESTDRTKREILDKLVDQELAKQQALAKKLDRSLEVLQLLESTKSEILARAYVEQIALAQPRPTPEEAKKYFVEHPELFSRRRVFELEEIVVEPKADLAPALGEQVKKGRTMQELAEWLKSAGARFTANRGIRAAEQIPLDLVPKLQPMKDGEIQVFDAATGGQQIVHLVASRPLPLNEADALPRIQQFLFNRSSSEAIAREVKAIKDKAKIEYIGEFSVGAAEAEAKAKAAAEAKAKAEAEANAKAGAEAKAKKAAAQAQADADAKSFAERMAKARAEADKARLEAQAKTKAIPAAPAQPPR